MFLIYNEKSKIKKNKFKRWVCAVIGFIIGFALSSPAILLIQLSGYSFYSRTGLDANLQLHFGERDFNDLTISELMVISYEYNSKNPRFFSKYFLHKDPGRYNVKLKTAIGGSSSAPTYFDPLEHTNGYDITSFFCDGGIISNNPALYSYSLSHNLLDKENIRVVSLGTGKQNHTEDKMKAQSKTTKASSISMLSDFMMNIETMTGSEFLRMFLNETQFVRMQVYTKAVLDSYQPKDVELMLEDGERLWSDPLAPASNEQLKKILRDIVDERFGPV